MKQNDDLSWIAGVADSGSSLCFVRKGPKFSIRLQTQQFEPMIAALEAQGLSPTSVERLPVIRVHFLALAACKFFGHVVPYMRSQRSRQLSELVFRYWRTAVRRGVRLTTEQRDEREQVKLDMKALRASGVA